MAIKLPERDLLRRPSIIRSLLAELRTTAAGSPACNFYRGAESHRKVLAAHEGGVSTDHYRNWMFRTGAKGLWAQYFEIWAPASTRQASWSLHAAYLTILELDRNSSVEVLAVHCDPTDTGAEPQGSFKRGPHLHVKCAREPIPKSHFPFNYGHLDQVLRDCDTLTKALEDALLVVKTEVLTRF